MSVVLFATQAGAEDFNFGDKFTCVIYRPVDIKGGADGEPYAKINPADPVNCFPIIEKYPTDYYKIVLSL